MRTPFRFLLTMTGTKISREHLLSFEYLSIWRTKNKLTTKMCTQVTKNHGYLASKDLLYTNTSEAKTILNSTQNNYPDFLHIFFRVLTTIRFPDFLVCSRLHTTPPSWGLCNQLLWRPSSVSNPAGWRPASPRRLRWLDRRGAQMRLQSVDW
jgi:hypothetical protein